MPKLRGKVVERRVLANGDVMTRREGHKYWDWNGMYGWWQEGTNGCFTCWGRLQPEAADELNTRIGDAKALTMIRPRPR
jgi:hypothetical protein